MDYLEAPFTTDFFVIDRRLPCNAEMSDSSSSLSDREISMDPEVVIMSCYAKPAKQPTDKTPLDERRYDHRAKVAITHTPKHVGRMYSPIEKYIASLALRLR